MSLPTGWAEATIGELCDLINGKAFKPTDWSRSGLPIIRIQNLNRPESEFNYFDKEVEEKIHSGEWRTALRLVWHPWDLIRCPRLDWPKSSIEPTYIPSSVRRICR